jgi:hypothetical protein
MCEKFSSVKTFSKVALIAAIDNAFPDNVPPTPPTSTKSAPVFFVALSANSFVMP